MSFCRDCLSDAPDSATRCAACRSPRLARHPELHSLTIAHIDCDAFYATIEKRDNPRHCRQTRRGRRRHPRCRRCGMFRSPYLRYSIGNADVEAKRRCPDAIVIKPNMAKYVQVGREVRRAMFALTPLVEPLSIDEAFLDLTGTERLHGKSAAKALAGFAMQVERDFGITISIGLSANKFLAKIASDLDKPRGFAVLGATEAGFISGQQASRFHLWCRRGQRGKTCGRRFPFHRRPAARRRARSHAALWR